MPSLKDVVAKEEQRKKRDSDNSRSLGVSQAFELGERSNNEYAPSAWMAWCFTDCHRTEKPRLQSWKRRLSRWRRRCNYRSVDRLCSMTERERVVKLYVLLLILEVHRTTGACPNKSCLIRTQTTRGVNPVRRVAADKNVQLTQDEHRHFVGKERHNFGSVLRSVSWCSDKLISL